MNRWFQKVFRGLEGDEGCGYYLPPRLPTVADGRLHRRGEADYKSSGCAGVP